MLRLLSKINQRLTFQVFYFISNAQHTFEPLVCYIKSVKDMYLNELLEPKVMTSSQHGLVSLSCFTKWSSWTIIEHNNNSLSLHELVTWKELAEKFLLKCIPIFHYLKILVHIHVFRFTYKWMREHPQKYNFLVIFWDFHWTAYFIEIDQVSKWIIVVYPCEMINIRGLNKTSLNLIPLRSKCFCKTFWIVVSKSTWNSAIILGCLKKLNKLN